MGVLNEVRLCLIWVVVNNNYIDLSQTVSKAFFTALSINLNPQDSNINANQIQVSGVKVRKEQESLHPNNVILEILSLMPMSMWV